MKDVEASKPFGVNMFGLGTSYKGSSGIDRDPADFGTPTTGPSARDADLGKGNRSGGGGSEETTQEAEMQVVWEELAVEEVEQVLTKWLVNKI